MGSPPTIEERLARLERLVLWIWENNVTHADSCPRRRDYDEDGNYRWGSWPPDCECGIVDLYDEVRAMREEVKRGG